MSKFFTYKELAHAEADLKRFSGMYAHEDKPLYLISVPEGHRIIMDPAISTDRIEAIGINGKIFTSKNHD